MITLRPTLIALTVCMALAVPAPTFAQAAESALPDIGSSAGELITPDEEQQYGGYLLYQLRHEGLILDDPLIDSWMQGMGHRLGAASDRPTQSFTFFMMRDRQINAFATLGGYIGVNAGLILTAETEDEVAGVLSHEIAHVTQRHMLRSVERAQKDQLPIMLAMLGAIVASQKASSQSSGDATAAVLSGGSALMQQRQIDYTRSNESESDRIGIQTLYRAGYNVNGMADFFERMARATRSNTGGYQIPEYLRSHPVTTTRISESRERAARLAQVPSPAIPATVRHNPLLPEQFSPPQLPAGSGPRHYFDWARERLRVLSASSPAAALAEYDALSRAPATRYSDAQRYGKALAQLMAGKATAAETGFAALLASYPNDLWLSLGMAEAAQSAGHSAVAKDRFEALLSRYPDHRAISLSYARVLNEIGTPEAGRRAQAVLRPLLASSADDPLFQRSLARASELAGDLPRAAEAYAEAAYLNGRAQDALTQLDDLKKRDDLDYYQRARVEARIAEITPLVLEMRRRGMEPQNQPTDRS